MMWCVCLWGREGEVWWLVRVRRVGWVWLVWCVWCVVCVGWVLHVCMVV